MGELTHHAGDDCPGGHGFSIVRTGSGAQLIAAERERQVTEEGYTAEHDAGHAEELILAAAAYIVNLTNSSDGVIVDPQELWPWAGRYWKPTEDVRRDLVKAGALIAAAIDAWPEAILAALQDRTDGH